MGVIKLSGPDWCFYRAEVDPEAHYRRMIELGVTGAELIDPARAKAAHAAGINILSTRGIGMTEGLNRIENHASLVPQLKERIAMAKDLNIPAFPVFSGNRQDQPDSEGIPNVVKGLEQVIAHAEAAGITLVFEMLNSYDHVDYQADSSKYGFDVVRTINSPNLRVLYDIYHMHKMDEDVLADITANLDIIAHIHLAENPGRGKPIAGGNIDYSAIVPAVIKAGYEGYWGFEFGPKTNPYEELAEVAEMFRTFS